MQPETPKLYTIVNNIVGNNVEINTGIDHSSYILYNWICAVFWKKSKVNYHNNKKDITKVSG